MRRRGLYCAIYDNDGLCRLLVVRLCFTTRCRRLTIRPIKSGFADCIATYQHIQER